MSTKRMQPSLARAIADIASTRPDMRLGTTDDQVTIVSALASAAGRARTLLESGLRTGDRVALVDGNSTDYAITWLACQLAGLPVALVNPTYPDELLERMLAPLDPRAILRSDDIALARACGDADVAGLPGLDADGLATASFMHTSGTTGLPKFCVQSHDYFHRLTAHMGGALELTGEDRVLAPLPLFHINPMGYGMVTALLSGADALTVGKFSASGFWPIVIDERITVLILHAPPVEILKRATTASDSYGHRVRTMFYADGTFMRTFAIAQAVSGYGSTEAGGVCHLRHWTVDEPIPVDASRHGGVGRPDFDWRVDDNGFIFVRENERAALFDGYVVANGVDPARDPDGWFDTGDIGRTEGGDYLVFIERGAESIRVKGEFVPIPFVEAQVSSVAGLRDYALWKRPGELVDDEVVLFVVSETIPIEAVRASVADLPTFMRPVAIARVAELPRDAAAGKVQRRLLDQTPVLEWVEV